MNKKFYITTPIYYVNDVPHVGHAYTTIAADIIARYHRDLLEEDVFFLTGTDEHGNKVAEAAKKAGKNPKDFCDEVSSHFKEAWENLNIHNDYFFRTTNKRHELKVQQILQKIYDRGFIYRDTYEGLYCLGCEKFLTEKDLVDGCCPFHPKEKPIKQKEKNYFFKLSVFKDELVKIIRKGDKLKILPKKREHEILSKLELCPNDISVSISREGVNWGIPLPWDQKQTVYVWADALLNYYTATQFLDKKEKFWPTDLHLIGKDILWFHAVIWPALLLAAELPLPKKIFVHGFFTIDGEKISKSLGNVISPDDLIEKFGIDGTRYLMFSQFPFGADGDISLEKFKIKYNADLSNGLGNLVSRVAKLCENSNFSFESRKEPSDEIKKVLSIYLNECQFESVLAKIWTKIGEADRFISDSKIWEQKEEKLKKSLQKLIFEIQDIAWALQPFVPQTAEKIKKIFEKDKIRKPEASLFPRLK